MATNDNLFAQLQPFTLAGAGAIVGATGIVLNSMETIDGGLVTMADFGTKGFATIEPGNGALEEQIVFTGITQNANGTATLTGVSNVLMIYPYTEASGTTKTHAGATTLVISNTSGFYNRLLSKDDDATITGLYTFPNGANTPVLGASYVAPTLQPQVASKGYVDAIAIAGAPNATTSVQGLVQLPTQAQVDAKTAVGSTGATLAVIPSQQRSTLESDYVVDTGAADAYVITPSPAITAYTTGQIFTWKSTHTNTTTSTLAVNGLTAKTIKKVDGATNLEAGDIVSGQMIQVEYDGTNFQMMNPLGRPAVYLTAGAYPAGTGANITGAIYAKKIGTFTTDVVIASSTTETTLFTVSVPGGLLSTNNVLWGYLNFNTLRLSDTKTCTLRLKYGGTTMITLVLTGSQAGQTNNIQGHFDFSIFAVASASVQAASLQFLGSDGALGNISIGTSATGVLYSAQAEGTAAIDSTSAQTFTISAQMNNSGTNDTLTASNGALAVIQ